MSISDDQDAMLRAARKKARQAIRTAFTQARSYLKGVEDASEYDIEWLSKIRPKFMTQGSYAYKTLNAPCYKSQEIDLDDGVYLPMSIMNTAPEANKDWFFAIVDGALRELAEKENWEFSNEKNTCARIIIPGKQAHIDIPLYAVPDSRHAHMVEAIGDLNVKLGELLFERDGPELKTFLLDENEIYLATRDEGWRKSDPLLIANWFKQQIGIKGQRLRRICCFLKAWRDYCWEAGGPSSLALMICAAEAYPLDDRGRDDYALLEVVKTLPTRLSGKIYNPACKYPEVVYPRGNSDQAEIVACSNQMLNALQSAVSGSLDKAAVVDACITQFGRRLPCRPEWIDVITSAEIVRSTPAVSVKPERIPNARSG
ncbi:CBASS cGAMP synthase [Thiohalobacter thiocyanaticus]|uniref:CBASS cGAMP synthase n=1 Tax=Thiohalobacter thiocyanaticus TaxID=585455 RepID=UPI00272CF1D2|nr:CBASS cGAMP synthase [Thiohalobacter thiocyanaticus]